MFVVIVETREASHNRLDYYGPMSQSAAEDFAYNIDCDNLVEVHVAPLHGAPVNAN